MKNIQKISKINIEPQLCNKCGYCDFACPFHIFQLMDSTEIPIIENPELCVSCGHCIAVCSTGAIIHSDFSPTKIKSINQKFLPSYNQILELFRTRRSIRSFSGNHIEKDVIRKIIEGACFAPSTNNIQSTKFTVIQDKEVINRIRNITAKYLTKIIRLYHNPLIRAIASIVYPEKTKRLKSLVRDYEKVLNSFKKQYDLIIHNAPVLIFFSADSKIGFTDVNASLALQNASLAIHSLGLGSFYAGYVVVACKNNEEIKKIINIPKKHQIYGCLGLGYPKLKYQKWIERKIPKIDWI